MEGEVVFVSSLGINEEMEEVRLARNLDVPLFTELIVGKLLAGLQGVCEESGVFTFFRIPGRTRGTFFATFALGLMFWPLFYLLVNSHLDTHNYRWKVDRLRDD